MNEPLTLEKLISLLREYKEHVIKYNEEVWEDAALHANDEFPTRRNEKMFSADGFLNWLSEREK